MPNFSDAQKQAQSQSESQNQSKEMKNVAKDLRASSQNLATTNANQTLQQQQLVQAIQQQSQQIQSLTMQVQSSALRQPPPLAPPAMSRPTMAPAFQQAGQMAGQMGGAIGGHMASRGQELGGMAFHQYERMRHTGAGIQRGTPGLINAPQSGLIGGAFHASGLSWNPTAAQSYGFGAYQEAQSHNAGLSARGWGMGAMQTGMGMLSAGGLGSIAGGIIGGAMGGPLAPVTAGVGSLIGGAMAAPMDYFNPLSFGMAEAQRAAGFGASANQNSNSFLRGMGGRGGAFGMREQAQIGKGMARMSMKDLTFSNEDIQGAQGAFADAGLMLGTQSSEQYLSKFKKLMGTQKTIMKALQLTQEEAVNFMDTAFSDIGVDPGSKMSMLASQVGAAGHIAGLSPMQTAKMMAAGGQGANAMGLMNLTGARTMGSAIGLGGNAASGAVNTRTLASVGGEQGLIGVLAQAQNRFLAGPGGAMGVLGGNKSGGVFERLGGLGKVSGNQMIDFAAGGNEMVDDMMEKDPNYARRQMIMDLSQMADMMPGKNKRSKMILLAKSQLGMGQTEAQALIDSAKALPGTLAKEAMGKRRNATNLKMDQIAEQRGLINRFKLGAREMMGEDMGGNAVMDTVLDSATELGVGAEIGMRNISDKMYGIKERSLIGQGVYDKVKKMGIDEFGGGSSNITDYDKKVRHYMKGGGSDGKLLRDALEDASGGTKSATAWDVGSRAAAGGFAGGAVTMGFGTLPGAIAAGADAIANPDYDFDVQKMRKIAQAIKQGDPVKSGMELDSLTLSKTMSKSEKRDLMSMGRESGWSPEKLQKLGDKIGYNVSVDKVKTEEELASDTQKALGIGSNFKPEDFNRAMDSPIFQEILGDIDTLMKMHDFNDSGNNATNKKYQAQKRKIQNKITKLQSEDPEAATTAMQILKDKGITLGDNGLEVDAAAQQIKDGIKSEHSKYEQLGHESFELNKAAGARGLFNTVDGLGDFNADRLQQGKVSAIGQGLGAVGLGAGITVKDGLDDDEKSKIVADVGGFSDEKIQDLIGQGGNSKLIGQIAARAKKDGGLSEKMQKMLIGSLRNLGATATGAGVDAGGLDGGILGAQTTAAFNQIQETQSSQIQILKKIAEEL